MAKIRCFSGLFARNKKSKESSKVAKKVNGNGDLKVNPEELVDQPIENAVREVSFRETVASITQGKSSSKNVKVVRDDNRSDYSMRKEAAAEAAYEGGDEHDEILSMKRDYSDFDLQALAEENDEISSKVFDQDLDNDGMENKLEKVEGITPEVSIHNGHVSDPGMGWTAMWGSPMLKRSCSNIETKRASTLIRYPTESNSSDDVHNVWGSLGGEATDGIPGSPSSVMTSFSADRVMPKKRSSCQVLPSRSVKLWWKLFLWSHRNRRESWISIPQRIAINDTSRNNDGYCSVTLESSPCFDMKDEPIMEEPEIKSKAVLWPQNQLVAFSAESSSLDRVNAWVHSLGDSPFCPIDNDENDDGEAAEQAFSYPNSIEVGESSGKKQTDTDRYAVKEVMHANIFQSLHSFPPVAHIAGMGLKLIPAISAFSSLRSVNLSGNLIDHISSGMLPKSLHTLDLSRNKISTIEGLRELTRLRILNLSYNRISRINHGLSNCTLIKELYLAGNKISNIDGFHRLLKLTVLDLSFNKISTAKAFGQLAANYDSLLALNLLGNPVQSNTGEEQLRKAICSFLPRLTYLNKQRIKPLRGREVATDSIAKVALGSNDWRPQRRLPRRTNQSSNSSAKSRTGEGNSHRGVGSGGGHKSSRHRSKGRHQQSISTRGNR